MTPLEKYSGKKEDMWTKKRKRSQLTGVCLGTNEKCLQNYCHCERPFPFGEVKLCALTCSVTRWQVMHDVATGDFRNRSQWLRKLYGGMVFLSSCLCNLLFLTPHIHTSLLPTSSVSNDTALNKGKMGACILLCWIKGHCMVMFFNSLL